MTTLVYDNAQQQFISGAWNWPSLAVNAALLSSTYTPLGSNVNLSEIPPSAFLVRDQPLTSLFVSAQHQYTGKIPQFDSFLSVYPVAALVLYVKGADDGSSPLIYYSDDGTGFPFAAEGFNYYVSADSSVGGFFQKVAVVTSGHIVTQAPTFVISTQSGLEFVIQ
jgi:hypothetical protein